jgi:hypothetical protein
MEFTEQDVLDARRWFFEKPGKKKTHNGGRVLMRASLYIGIAQDDQEVTVHSNIAPTVVVREGAWYRQITLLVWDEENTISIQEASDRFGMSIEYWRRECAAGRIIGARKSGNAWRIPLNWLQTSQTYGDGMFGKYENRRYKKPVLNVNNLS